MQLIRTHLKTEKTPHIYCDRGPNSRYKHSITSLYQIFCLGHILCKNRMQKWNNGFKLPLLLLSNCTLSFLHLNGTDKCVINASSTSTQSPYAALRIYKTHMQLPLLSIILLQQHPHHQTEHRPLVKRHTASHQQKPKPLISFQTP